MPSTSIISYSLIQPYICPSVSYNAHGDLRLLLSKHLFLQVKCVAVDLSVLDNGNSHGSQQVVSGVGVGVDMAVESLGSVLPERSSDQSLATWVFLDKVLNVVNNARNNEKTLLLGNLVKVCHVPDRQLRNLGTPVQLSLHLVELLLLLLEQTLLNGILRESLEVPCKAKLGKSQDGQLGWVVLVPLQSVSVVRWELVVEVVVALTEGDESGQDVVSRGSSIIKRLGTNPVSQGVDTEGNLLNEEVLENTGVDEATVEVAPTETGNQGWQTDSGSEHDHKVVTMLENDDRVQSQVGDVSSGSVLWVSLGQHPAHVGVPETLTSVIWVSVCVGVSVVNSVRVAPPLDGTLNGTGTKEGKESSRSPVGVVGLVRVQTMVTGGDRNTGKAVQDKGKSHGLQLGRSGVGGPHAKGWDGHHQGKVQPVDVLVPVGQSPWLVRDMLLLGPFLTLGLVLLVESLGIGGKLLGSNIDQGLGTHQLTAQTGGDDSWGFLVSACSESIKRRDVHGIQLISHD